jgi:hypothetical protein
MKLKTETENGETLVEIRNTPEGVIMQPSYVGYLKSSGYQIREINDTHTVQSSSGDCSYLVWNIGTYPFPANSSLLDVADENQQIDLWVCSCPQWRFRESVDVTTGVEITPDQCGTCKHIEQCDKTVRAREDDSQETLFEEL